MERLLRTITGKEVPNKVATKKYDSFNVDKLSAAINKFLEAQSRDKDGPIKKEHFSPSATATCKRYYYLLFDGAEQKSKISSRLQRIFDNGHDVHARWRGYFEAMGILHDSEVFFANYDIVPIRGSADGILNFGKRIPYELKSINKERYAFRQLHNKPDDNTYRQLQLYMWALAFEVSIVIYENKDNQEFLIFVVEYDEKFVAKELEKRRKIYQLYQEGKRPPRPYKRESRACSDCPLETYCWDTLDD